MADPAFEALVQALMSPDNPTRNAAEASYAEHKAANLPSVAANLCAAMAASGSKPTRMMAAVLLRRVCDVRGEEWAALDDGSKGGTMTQALEAFKNEVDPTVARRVGFVVSQLAVSAGVSGWPALVPTVFEVAQSPEDSRRAVAYSLLAELCEGCSDDMEAVAEQLHAAFDAGLQDPRSLDVRVAATQATVAYVGTLSKKERELFQSLLGRLFQVLDAALRGEGAIGADELAAREVLQALIDLARLAPTFVHGELARVGESMNAIANAKEDLDPETEKLAMEMLLTLSEHAGGMVRTCAPLISTTLTTAFSLMFDVEEDAEWDTRPYNSEAADADEDVDSCAAVGEEAVYRLSKALGGNAVLEVAFSLIPSILGDAAWQRRRAGVVGIAMTAEGSLKVMKDHLEYVMGLVEPMMEDPHPRVRHAAIMCIGHLASDFKEHSHFQKKFGARVLPMLATAMKAAGNPWRVRAHAATALVNFCEDPSMPYAVLEPHMAMLVEAMIDMLGGGIPSAQAQALSALSAVARCSGSSFAEFYSMFMPGLKVLIQTCADAAETGLRIVRGKAMECVGIIAGAVGPDVFFADAKEIMDMLLAAAAGGFPIDDPQTRYVVEAGARVCKVLGQECLPYLPMLVPPLVAAVQKDPGASVTAVDPDEVAQGAKTETPEGVDSVVLEMRGGMGSVRFSVMTSVLEEISMAVRCLYEYAEELGAVFYPYVETVSNAVVPLIQFKWNHEVRLSAACAAPRLLASYIEGLRTEGKPITGAQPLLDMVMPPLVNQLLAERDGDTRIALAEAIKEVLETCRETAQDDDGGSPAVTLAAELLPALSESLMAVAGESIHRREEMVQVLGDTDFRDEEAEAQVEEALEAEEELMEEVINSIGHLIKSLKAAFIPVLDDKIAGNIAPLLAPEVPSALRVNALCPFVDAIEYCGEAGAKYVPMILEILVSSMNDENPGLRQICAYGFSICVKHALAQTAAAIGAGVKELVKAVARDDAEDEDARFATENCASAIARIVEAAGGRPGVDEADLLPYWLMKLPLVEDSDEAHYSHALLCRYVQEGNATVLGADYANLPHVMNVFGQILAAPAGGGDDGVDMASDETRAQMATIIRSMQTSLPAEVFNGCFGGLEPAVQEAITAAVAAAEA